MKALGQKKSIACERPQLDRAKGRFDVISIGAFPERGSNGEQ
jgi:hypothetical protein